MLGLLAALQGATHADPPSPLAGSGYLLRAWSTEDGLPENSATAIAQRRDGCLWFGTWSGLVRYNGDRFTVFDPANTPQLPSAAIVNLHVDQRDRLWVSTMAGLVVSEGTQWRPLGTNEGWVGNHVRTFAERANGDLLMTTFDGHVLAVENDRLAELPSPPGEPGMGYLGAADTSGSWWVAQNRFIGYWDGQRWVKVHAPGPTAGRSAVACATARGGGVWVWVAGALLKFRGGSLTYRSSLPQLRGGIWSMGEDSRTNLWICSYDSGLYQVTPAGELRQWTTANGLGTAATRVVFEDREENLWIGTSGDGLRRLTRQRFFSINLGIPGSRARSVAPARDGAAWIALYDSGLHRHEERSTTRVLVPGPKNESSYGLSVIEDRAGRLWYGDQDSCWVRRSQDRFEKAPLKPATGAEVTALFEDAQGRIWIATQEGAVVYDGTDYTRLGPEAGLPPGKVACFGEDASGSLWLAKSEGVYRQVEDRFTAVRDTDGQSLPGVLCFLAEADGSMWMGTRAACLIRWRQGRTDRVEIETGLPRLEVRGFIEDARDHVWMPSNRGVLRASRQQLHAVADRRVPQVEFQVLDRHDGLPSAECSVAQPNCMRDRSGRLWFATQKGVAVVDPAEFRLESEPPPVQVEQLTYRAPKAKSKAKADRRPGSPANDEVRLRAPFSQPLRLPPGTYGIDIESAAPSLTAPEKVRFDSELKGKRWASRNAGNDRFVRFHRLPPGDYVFRVRAANHDGVWNPTGASLAFTVLPYFWQTRWFQVGAGLLLAALGGASVWSWSRRKTARALDRERVAHEMRQLREELAHADRVSAMAQLASGLAHELGQPLGAILRNAEAAEVLIEEQPPDLAELRAILADVRQDDQRAAGVIQRMRTMLKRQTVEHARLSIAEVIEEVAALVGHNTRERHVQLSLEIAPDLPAVIGDRIQLQQVLLNLVLNGMDAMSPLPPERRRLILRAQRSDGGMIEVSVRDSGPGVAAPDVARIFQPFFSTKPDGLGIGLAVSKTLIEAHEGRIWYEPLPEGGACFCFTLPVVHSDGGTLIRDRSTVSGSPESEMRGP
ncbi:MAG TPA: two-component regulator propeller domain-containing protein [Verrucomicrobiota bacterium]|nr:two-component regulator propeller domain-containing protein [Verrucomicrobiota bacterium]HNU52511.1 two-component regulator propeller domain-containing protein [Verrucomicrobiota bacterium]